MTEDERDVGSVGEEAAKLFEALAGWTGDPAGWSTALETVVDNVNEHVATESENCRYCPVCQVIHAVRQTNPEVKAHLTTAASSLLQAAAGLLATHVPEPEEGPGHGVEKIDLSDEGPWDEEP